jgi:diguanylate cyclase (GGDEF)-like protein
MDIDFFKHYNDTHGHPRGDELLKSFSAILKKTIRDSDIASRYGGEEFVVILPETGGELAFTAAERVRKAIETKDFPGGETQPGGRVTVSMGVSSYTEGISVDELLKSADKALYRAKGEGRNRVCKIRREEIIRV